MVKQRPEPGDTLSLNRREATSLTAALALGACAPSMVSQELNPMNTQNHPLIAAGPYPSLGAHADTFGRIVGSWAGEFRDNQGGVERRGEMEVHLYWVLEGRAVQDVWITPSRNAMESGRLSPLYYGSTMRIFDAATESWRMFWFNPVQPFMRGELVGRRVGDDIVQLGSYGDTPIKWVFEDITPNSFTWRGYWLGPVGGDWNLSTEFFVRRS